MDKFLTRPVKRARGDGDRDSPVLEPPAVIVSWNCNSLRMRVDRKEIGAAVASFLEQGAQAIVLQEVRLKPEDRSACESALKMVGLSDWRFYWSLHPDNKRYSGTALAVHPAHAPLTVRFDLKGLADPAIKYPLVMNAQKAASSEEASRDPEREGRLIIAEYARCWLVCVYVPLCSWYAAGRTVRAAWDARFSSAIQALQRGVAPAPPKQAISATAGSSSQQQAGAGEVQAAQGSVACNGTGAYTPSQSDCEAVTAAGGSQQAGKVGATEPASAPAQERLAQLEERLAHQPAAGVHQGVAPAAGGAAGAAGSMAEQKEAAQAEAVQSEAVQPGSTSSKQRGGASTQRTPSGSLKPSKITSFFGVRAAPSSSGVLAKQPAQPPVQQSAQQCTQPMISITASTAPTPAGTAQPRAAQPAAADTRQTVNTALSAEPSAAAAAGTRIAGGVTGRPVIVAGDINVCHTPNDVSHPEFFANAMKPRNVGGGDPGLPGQPGYCEDERERFGRLLLSDCALVDTWRALHPGGKRFTWGFAQNFEVGRYAGKYMGLDYFLVAQQLWDAGLVQGSEILGSSAQSCFGSDHLPVLLRCDWSKAGQLA